MPKGRILPCWLCGGIASELDHVIPLAAGGTDDPSNLRPACQRCNRSRGARSVAEFMDRQSRQPEWPPRTVYSRRRPTLRGDYTR